jgi:hypothetical protein
MRNLGTKLIRVLPDFIVERQDSYVHGHGYLVLRTWYIQHVKNA